MYRDEPGGADGLTEEIDTIPDFETLGIAVTDTVAVVTLRTGPEGLMSEGMERDLAAAIEVMEGEPGIRCVVLTGAQEDYFLRHYDVAAIHARASELKARGLHFDPARPVPEAPIHTALRRMETGDTIYIAAINGTAMGGGFELALACDLRLVEDGPYDLGLPEINLGILPGAGGTQRLPRLIGEARALELTLTGDTISPRRAAEIGLAVSCVEAPVLEPATALAQRIAAKPAAACRHIKHLVRGALDTDPATGHARERTLFCDLMIRDDALRLMQEWTEGKRDIRDDPD